MRTMDVPRSRSPRRTPNRRTTSDSPSRLVDSSRISTRGSAASALPTSTSSRSPGAQRVEARAWIDVDVDQLEDRPGQIVVAAPPERRQSLREAGEEQVLGDAHRRARRRLLGHERDPRVERLARHRERASLAVDEDLTAVRMDRAGEDLRERRLARAVLARERDDLALRDREVDVEQRLNGPVALRYASCFEQVGVLFEARGVRGRAARRATPDDSAISRRSSASSERTSCRPASRTRS